MKRIACHWRWEKDSLKNMQVKWKQEIKKAKEEIEEHLEKATDLSNKFFKYLKKKKLVIDNAQLFKGLFKSEKALGFFFRLKGFFLKVFS